MGFVEREQRGSKFLNFKEGKIIHSKDGEQIAHDGFIGRAIDLDIQDKDYQGVDYRKITLYLEDPDSGLLYELGFSLESGYGNAFCCIAPNVDWKRSVEISGKVETKNGGKKYAGLFIRQDGKPVKWFFTNAGDEKEKDPKKKRPAVEKVKVGNKDVFDFTKRNAFYEKVIAGVRKKIVAASGGLAEHKPKVQKSEDSAEWKAIEGEEVPF